MQRFLYRTGKFFGVVAMASLVIATAWCIGYSIWSMIEFGPNMLFVSLCIVSITDLVIVAVAWIRWARHSRAKYAHIRVDPERYFALLVGLNDLAKHLIIEGERKFSRQFDADSRYSHVALVSSFGNVRRAAMLVSEDRERVYDPESLRDVDYAHVTIFKWYTLACYVSIEHAFSPLDATVSGDDGEEEFSFHVHPDMNDQQYRGRIKRFGPLEFRFKEPLGDDEEGADVRKGLERIEHLNYATCEDLEELLQVFEAK